MHDAKSKKTIPSATDNFSPRETEQCQGLRQTGTRTSQIGSGLSKCLDYDRCRDASVLKVRKGNGRNSQEMGAATVPTIDKERTGNKQIA